MKHNVYFGGTVQSIGFDHAGGSATVGVMEAGEYEFSTGAKERMDEINSKAAADRKDIGEKAAEAGKSAAEATKSAVDAVAKLPVARVMTGRERCATAPNGAPDCLAAAQALCRKHGFSSGQSMDFTSAEECPTRVWMSGRPTEAECATVTFISRAMCQ